MANETVIILNLDTGEAEKVLKGFEGKAKRRGKQAGDNYENAFEKETGAIGRGLSAGFSRLGAAAAAAAAGIAAAFAGRAIIGAAAKQQDAVNNLNASLRRTGQFSAEISQDLQNFASSLQAVTTVGDETTLELLALSQAFGFSAEQSKVATEAALNLAAAAGISAEEATRRLGRTISGSIEDVSKFAPAIKNLTKEQLAAGDAALLLNNALAGAAAAQRNTFSGAVTALANDFGDLLEAIGSLVTSSPAIVGAFNGISKVLQGVSKSIGEFQGQGDIFGNVLISLIDKGGAFAVGFQVIFSRVSQVFGIFINGLKTGVLLGIKSFSELAAAGARLAEAFGLDGALTESLKSFDQTISEGLKSSVDGVNAGLDSLGQPIDTTGLEDSLLTIRESIREAQLGSGGIIGGAVFGNNQDTETPGVKPIEGDGEQTFEGIFGGLGEQLKQLDKTAAVTSASVAKSLKTGIATGAANAFSAFGKALATGEDGLKAFGTALLQAFGQSLVQLGQGFILQGIAQSLAGFGSGAPLIAAGAALALFGGVLSGIGGGGSAPTANPGQTGSGVTITSPEGGQTFESLPEEELREQTQVNLRVDGNIFNTEETARELTTLIAENIDAQDVFIRGRA
jgi:hypothetical protein